MKEAYTNDKRVNRDSKVTDNERGMLNVLSAELSLTTDECAAQQDVLNYITMWYNSHRLHSYLDYQSPNVFELVGRELEMVA
ncbi:MAG: hypothetical protein ACJA2G_000835 [Cognaticolwellia sp.]|jgi:hypothetical protein